MQRWRLIIGTILPVLLVAEPAAAQTECEQTSGSGELVGTLLGAAVGGLVGSQIGSGRGKTVAIGAGVLARVAQMA